MRVQLKSLTAVFLALMILISNFIGIFLGNIAYAQSEKQMKVTELNVEPSSIEYGRKFTISGKFGGQGYTAKNGETLQIPFKADGVNISIANKQAPIMFQGHDIGTIEYSSSGITIKFNEKVEELNNVEGSFYIEGNAHNTNTDDTNTGTIKIGSGEYEKEIKVKYIKTESGTTTENVYRKSGIADPNNTDDIRWAFILNAVKKTFSNKPYYTITDKLNSDMNWNKVKSKSNPYIVQIGERYVESDQLSYYGIWINFKNDKEVEIKVNSDYMQGTEITINLYASLTEEVQNNPDKKLLKTHQKQ
ncbi:hypothetical protein ACGCUP_00135 [Eubacteriales bacterium KG125]